MKKKRTTISLNQPIANAAQELMARDAYDDFSAWLEQVIREKWRAVHGEAPLPVLHDSPAPPAPPTPGRKITSYGADKKRSTGNKGIPRKLPGHEN